MKIIYFVYSFNYLFRITVDEFQLIKCMHILQLAPRLSNDFTAALLTFTFPQLFAVAATLKSIDYNVAMTFILNNNNNTTSNLLRLISFLNVL